MKNMMKKLTALLLVLLMCFTLCACSSEKAEEGTTAGNTITSDVSIPQSTEPSATELTTTEEPTTEEVTLPSVPADDNAAEKEEGITPLLYKVTDADGNVVWLFGSIHVGKEEFYPLPDYVTDDAVDRGTVKRKTAEGFHPELWKQILYHREKWVSPSMQTVLDIMTEHWL